MPKISKRPRYSKTIRTQALRDYQKGARVPELAKRYGASVPTLYNWLRAAGATRRKVTRSGSEVKKLQAQVVRLAREVKLQRKRQLRLIRVLKRGLDRSLQLN